MIDRIIIHCEEIPLDLKGDDNIYITNEGVDGEGRHLVRAVSGLDMSCSIQYPDKPIIIRRGLREIPNLMGTDLGGVYMNPDEFEYMIAMENDARPLN